MQKTINLFSQYLQGDWVVQENLYSLCVKNIQTHRGKVKFPQNINFMNTLEQNNSKDISYDDYSIETVKGKFYVLVSYNKKKNKKRSYEEYIYKTSNNVIISFGILKNMENNKYIGLKVSSYIRIL